MEIMIENSSPFNRIIVSTDHGSLTETVVYQDEILSNARELMHAVANLAELIEDEEARAHFNIHAINLLEQP
jgi:hypothetical protein